MNELKLCKNCRSREESEALKNGFCSSACKNAYKAQTKLFEPDPSPTLFGDPGAGTVVEKLKGAEISDPKELKVKQEDRVLSFFRINPERAFSASYVWSRLFAPATPLTSVRRSITNLRQRGDLITVKEKAPGLYGKPERQYKFSGLNS